jgi:hypothetical protein
MASMARRSPPADLGGAELSRSRATPEKWEPGWLRLAYKATCRRELAQLAVKHLAPVLSQCHPRPPKTSSDRGEGPVQDYEGPVQD